MAIHPSAEERRTEDRLRSLLAADRMIAAELSLPGLLRRIVSVARDVVDARYAAMGVVGPDGLLEQFIHCGMDEATVDAIGELPKGRGLLGAVIEEADPIRLRAAEEDGRSCGVPLNHPTITSFLGVPVRSASSVYGNLYLTNRIHAPDFSGEDEDPSPRSPRPRGSPWRTPVSTNRPRGGRNGCAPQPRSASGCCRVTRRGTSWTSSPTPSSSWLPRTRSASSSLPWRTPT